MQTPKASRRQLLGGARHWRTVIAVLLSEFRSPIEPTQSGEAPNLLRFYHIAAENAPPRRTPDRLP
jgi:hypothetical protein